MSFKPSMGFGENLQQSKAPEFRICCNVGSMFDLPNATLLKGKWGNTFLMVGYGIVPVSSVLITLLNQPSVNTSCYH